MRGASWKEFPSIAEGATGLGDETVRHPQARFAFSGGRFRSPLPRLLLGLRIRVENEDENDGEDAVLGTIYLGGSGGSAAKASQRARYSSAMAGWTSKSRGRPFLMMSSATSARSRILLAGLCFHESSFRETSAESATGCMIAGSLGGSGNGTWHSGFKHFPAGSKSMRTRRVGSITAMGCRTEGL